MSNSENMPNSTTGPASGNEHPDQLMTIGEAISYMCEQLGRISRTTFYRCGYRKMITVRSYGRNTKNGRKAIKLCRKSEIDYLINLIQENPHAENL